MSINAFVNVNIDVLSASCSEFILSNEAITDANRSGLDGNCSVISVPDSVNIFLCFIGKMASTESNTTDQIMEEV